MINPHEGLPFDGKSISGLLERSGQRLLMEQYEGQNNRGDIYPGMERLPITERA